MIEVKDLYKSFDDKEVLKGINTIFEDGKTNLIIGQSGSGKTVLMKNLVGLLEPTSGQVLYDGRDFVQMSKQEKVMMRREMGMIFQSAALFDSLTVLENVMFPLDMFSPMTLHERTQRARECLDRVNLIGAEKNIPVKSQEVCRNELPSHELSHSTHATSSATNQTLVSTLRHHWSSTTYSTPSPMNLALPPSSIHTT